MLLRRTFDVGDPVAPFARIDSEARVAGGYVLGATLRASVLVEAPPERACRVFTEEFGSLKPRELYLRQFSEHAAEER